MAGIGAPEWLAGPRNPISNPLTPNASRRTPMPTLRWYENDGQMTPKFALAASLIYYVMAKPRSQAGELSALIGRLTDDLFVEDDPAEIYALVSRALAYVERTAAPQLVSEAVAVLDERQRLCVLLNLLDFIMIDGQLEPVERAFLRDVQRAFGLPDSRVDPLFEAIVLKNIRAAVATPGPGRLAA
jgi:uncharacterized tellurite resistance protein B-like protein